MDPKNHSNMNNTLPVKLIAFWKNETSMVGNVSQLLRQNWTARVDEGVPRNTLKFWFTVFISVCMLGVLNNILLLTIISSSKKLRSGTGILILHLLVACLLMCAIHYPILGILIYGNNYWFILPKNLCSYIHYALVTTTYAYFWSDACLGINRFVAVIFPHHYAAWSTRRVCLCMIASTWMIGGLTTLPACFGYSGYFSASSSGQCAMLGTNLLGNFLLGFNAFTSYVIVGIVVLAVLSKIIWRRFAADRSSAVQVVAANEENIRAAQPQETPQQRKAYMKQLRMAGILLTSFTFCAFCNLPRSVASSYFSQYTSHMPVLLLWLRLLVGIQFAFVPLVFLAFNQDYRKVLRKRFFPRPNPIPPGSNDAITLRTAANQ